MRQRLMAVIRDVPDMPLIVRWDAAAGCGTCSFRRPMVAALGRSIVRR
jgi:NAD-dependent dihydropyrimidine dehydrogenase PreA subunit